MTYLVLGSNSFAGSTYIQELLARGEQVIGVSRSPEASSVLLAYSGASQKNYSFYALDINRDFEEIRQVCQEYKPQYVIDFASQSMVAESWLYPEQWYTTNIVAKVKLHEFLRQTDYLERYVRISTPEVFGHSDIKITEEQPFNPTTPYAVSQAAIDMSLEVYHKQYQFPVLFTRYANFYGPYQQLYRIIPRTIIYGLLNKKLPLHGGGLSKRAFIYGTDVARAIDTTIEHGEIGGAYHFSAGECVKIVDLVEQVARSLRLNFDDFVDVVAERPGKDAQYLMDTSKAERELQWYPAVSLEQGLENTISWVSQNIDKIKALPLAYEHKP